MTNEVTKGVFFSYLPLDGEETFVEKTFTKEKNSDEFFACLSTPNCQRAVYMLKGMTGKEISHIEARREGDWLPYIKIYFQETGNSSFVEKPSSNTHTVSTEE